MSNVIRIENAFENGPIGANTEIAFILENIRNPEKSIDAETIAREFIIQTVSPRLYPIDGSYNLDFAIGCVFPCATCDSIQTKCLTCLTLDDGTPLNFLESQSTCMLECPAGFRVDSIRDRCEECKPGCAKCTTDS